MKDIDLMARILRIIKIYKIEFPYIGCVFSNGEYKVINVKSLFEKLGIKKGEFGAEVLDDEALFQTVELNNNTLSWKNLQKQIKLSGGRSKSLFFDLDPLMLYKNSKADPSKSDRYKIGRTIKHLRYRLNLTQDKLAQAIGSNKQYLSRIENDRSDIEFNTLKRIFEVGFEKKIFISYFEENDFINTYSNSIFTNSFLSWIESNNTRLDLIEGIEDKLKKEFEKKNIRSTADLANLPFEELKNILASYKRPFSFYHFPETWCIQAKYLQHRDWFNLLKLQRMLKKNPDVKEDSKLEIIAKKETRHDVFDIV